METKTIDFPRAPSTVKCGFEGRARERPAVIKFAPGLAAMCSSQ